MKSILTVVGLFFTLITFSVKAEAGTLTIPGSAGNYYGPTAPYCFNLNGYIQAIDSGICLMTFAIPIDSGKQINSVTAYYYDNSGSQSILGSVRRIALSTNTSETILASFSDNITSASVQFYTMNVNTVTSSSYAYYVYISLGASAATQLRGIKISYQ